MSKDILKPYDNFKIIYRILNALETSLDYDQFNQELLDHNIYNISEARMKHYLSMLQEAGYIDGVTVKEYADGTRVYNTDDIRITIKGLEYLSENSIMQQIYKTVKGIKDIIK